MAETIVTLTVAAIIAALNDGASTGYSKALRALLPVTAKEEVSFESAMSRVRAFVTKDDGEGLARYILTLDSGVRRDVCRELRRTAKATNSPKATATQEDGDAEEYAAYVAWKKAKAKAEAKK